MLGLVGCGTMGSALVRGLILQKIKKPQDILIYDKEIGKRIALKEQWGITISPDPISLCMEAKTIFIAVKPQDMEGLLLDLKPALTREHLLVSLAAGLKIKYYEELLGGDIKIIRVMPNTPCLVGEGMIVISRGERVSKEEEVKVKELMEALGTVLLLEEKYMDAVTGLSGSGPAYALLFLEALADGGVEMGLSRDVAFLLAAQTLLGAARMALESNEHPAELKNKVTSPGGTTSAGLLAMEEGGVRASIIKAVIEATKRGKNLGR
ncbi:MAG: pyrroline-5-carboxylate reductase [Dethiobacteria bacterium]